LPPLTGVYVMDTHDLQFDLVAHFTIDLFTLTDRIANVPFLDWDRRLQRQLHARHINDEVGLSSG